MINHKFGKIIVFTSVLLMGILSGMEFDLFVPSFPELKSFFNLTPFWVEALLSINYAGYCLSLFFVGALADHYGRKPVILSGLFIFIIGSIMCTLTPNFLWLLFGRFLQGAGIAAPATLSFLIIADSYPLKKQQFLITFLNGAINAAMGAAPVIGSYIAQHYGWQGNFTALLIMGLVTLVLSVFCIPNYKLPELKETISIRQYIPIVTSKPLMLLVAHLVFMLAPYWIFVGMSPILYIEDLHVSLLHFGWYQGSLALLFGIGSVLFGLFIEHFDQKKMLRVANILFIISLVCIGIITYLDSRDPLLITLAFLPFLIAEIIPCTILYTLCLNFMPHAKGRVCATIQGSRLLLSALFLQIAGYFYSGSFQNIGIIIVLFIILSIVTLWLIIKNKELSDFSAAA